MRGEQSKKTKNQVKECFNIQARALGHLPSLPRVARLTFFTPNFTNLAFFRGSWRQKNCLDFWLFFNIWLFWRQLAHPISIRLVFWLSKCLAEKCC